MNSVTMVLVSNSLAFSSSLLRRFSSHFSHAFVYASKTELSASIMVGEISTPVPVVAANPSEELAGGAVAAT